MTMKKKLHNAKSEDQITEPLDTSAMASKATSFRGTLDHTFSNLFSTVAKSITAVTLTVSIGKALTQYYFVILMAILIIIMGTLSYIDLIRKQPQARRGYFQNHLYAAYERVTERHIDTVLYNIASQQSKLLTNSTPRNQSAHHQLSNISGSDPNLAAFGSPRLGNKCKKA